MSKYNKGLTLGAFAFITLATLFPTDASAQVAEPTNGSKESTEEWVRITPEEYIYKYRNIAIENMEVYGIPASITMGQAILESGYGNGYLARAANNHFCIKCRDWDGPTITHADDNPNDCFRVYESAEESFHDHAEFLNSGSRYDFLFAYDDDDYKSWARGLKKAGYATAEDYAERLINVIERYNLPLLDKRNGLELYDKYLVEKHNIDLSTLQPAPETNIATTTPPPATGENVAAVDIATAYADRGLDPNNFRVSITSHKGYNVYLTNRTHYIVAKEGDSYESLSQIFNVSAANLRRFNDVAKGTRLNEGDIVYIERKLPMWMGVESLHTVREGETLYHISQLYGIRLNKLSKINTMRRNATLSEGRTIRIK